MKLSSIVALAILAAGCANRGAVFAVGEGRYQVNTSATWELGGLTAARTMALEEATRHCSTQGRSLQIIDSKEAYGHFSGGTVGLTFSCK